MRVVRLVLLGACLTTIVVGAIAIGGGAIGGLVGAVVAIAALSARAERKSKPEDRVGLAARQPGDLIRASREVVLPPGNTIDELAEDLSTRFGLHQESRDGHSIKLKGGSQWRLRLLGGYHIDPRHLPSRVELTPVGGGSVRISVEDALGIAIRDAGLEARYGRLLGELAGTAAA